MDENLKQTAPREEFELKFGNIDDEKWQWLKEFCQRNYIPNNKTVDFDFNEYSTRDENGDWWLIGGPNGPIKMEHPQIKEE